MRTDPGNGGTIRPLSLAAARPNGCGLLGATTALGARRTGGNATFVVQRILDWATGAHQGFSKAFLPHFSVCLRIDVFPAARRQLRGVKTVRFRVVAGAVEPPRRSHSKHFDFVCRRRVCKRPWFLTLRGYV